MSNRKQNRAVYLTAGDYWIVLAVYTLYLAFLAASLTPAVRLWEAMSNLSWLHFILFFAYLFFLDRHEEYFWKNPALIRYGSRRAASAARKRLLIRESLVFWTPFLILEAAGGILDRRDMALTLCACLNFLMLAMTVGRIACLLSEWKRGTHWGVLLLGAVLSLDYLQAYGWLLPADGSLFYWNCMNPFTTLTADTVFRGCTLSFAVLLFLLLPPWEERLYSGRRTHSGLKTPVRELLLGSGMGILLALSCVREAGTAERLWLLTLGLGGRNNDMNLFGLIFDLMPFLVLLLSCGSGLSDRIKTAAVLVFPRAGSRDQWWKRWFSELICRVLAFFLSMLICDLAVGMGFGIFPMDWRSMPVLAASLLLCWSGFALILVLGMNIHGMRRDRREAFLLAAGALSIGYLADSLGKPAGAGTLIRRILVPARASLLIHGDCSAVRVGGDLFDRAVMGLSIWETGFVFLLCLTALYLSGLHRLRNMDYR